MPLISSFYGILIYIYMEKGSRHNQPHIHAMYGEHDMSIDFKGNKMAGDLPKKQNKLVEAWIAIHSEELNCAWTAYNKFGEIIKIKGLE
jgi:hypothetical protein